MFFKILSSLTFFLCKNNLYHYPYHGRIYGRRGQFWEFKTGRLKSFFLRDLGIQVSSELKDREQAEMAIAKAEKVLEIIKNSLTSRDANEFLEFFPFFGSFTQIM